MKKILITVILLAGLLLLSGCWVYGQGQTVGYVYAVDDDVLWDIVWYKSSLESSESDCYVIKNDELKQKLRQVSGDQKVKLYYKRHIATWDSCSEKTKTNDEIYDFEVLK